MLPIKCCNLQQLEGPRRLLRGARRLCLQVLTILALVLLAVETSAIRVFDQRHPLKREVGKVMRTRDGKFVSG